MRRTLVVVALVMPVCLMIGCAGEPEMVDPMATGLNSGAVSTEIIPIENVLRSQAAAVAQRVANTDITVTYSRPVARGRDLFGGIVPYDVVWNPGADRATAITVSRDVTIDGQPLLAGSYSIWAIPGPEVWSLIFNREFDVYHTPYPGEDQDELRISVRPERGAHMETLAFYFAVVEGKEAVLRLHWGEVIVPLTLRVP